MKLPEVTALRPFILLIGGPKNYARTDLAINRITNCQ